MFEDLLKSGIDPQEKVVFHKMFQRKETLGLLKVKKEDEKGRCPGPSHIVTYGHLGEVLQIWSWNMCGRHCSFFLSGWSTEQYKSYGKCLWQNTKLFNAVAPWLRHWGAFLWFYFLYVKWALDEYCIPWRGQKRIPKISKKLILFLPFSGNDYVMLVEYMELDKGTFFKPARSLTSRNFY